MRSPAQRQQYRERARSQALSWAMGRPYHNHIDGECCPDFSCCHPDLFEQDTAKRWAQYKAEYGSVEFVEGESAGVTPARIGDQQT